MAKNTPGDFDPPLDILALRKNANTDEFSRVLYRTANWDIIQPLTVETIKMIEERLGIKLRMAEGVHARHFLEDELKRSRFADQEFEDELTQTLFVQNICAEASWRFCALMYGLWPEDYLKLITQFGRESIPVYARRIQEENHFPSDE